jgi:hypothetical protein
MHHIEQTGAFTIKLLFENVLLWLHCAGSSLSARPCSIPEAQIVGASHESNLMRREGINAANPIDNPLLAGPFACRTVQAQNEEAAIPDVPLCLPLRLKVGKVAFARLCLAWIS